MIKLIIGDALQVDILEHTLQESGLEYEIATSDRNFGIPTPYLLVDGAPLDFERAMKYIKERTPTEKVCTDCKHFVGCECFDGKTCDLYTEGGDRE